VDCLCVCLLKELGYIAEGDVSHIARILTVYLTPRSCCMTRAIQDLKQEAQLSQRDRATAVRAKL